MSLNLYVVNNLQEFELLCYRFDFTLRKLMPVSDKSSRPIDLRKWEQVTGRVLFLWLLRLQQAPSTSDAYQTRPLRRLQFGISAHR